LPELPAPDEILKKPSDDEFRKKMRDLDTEAEEKKINIEESKYKRR